MNKKAEEAATHDGGTVEVADSTEADKAGTPSPEATRVDSAKP
jgi:hypothetical protein